MIFPYRDLQVSKKAPLRVAHTRTPFSHSDNKKHKENHYLTFKKEISFTHADNADLNWMSNEKSRLEVDWKWNWKKMKKKYFIVARL